MNDNNQKLSIVEKVGYSLGDLAANLIFQFLVNFLSYFYTDIYKLSNNHSSLVIMAVGLVAAFAFNPLIGALADRTKSRWGKFRPWILFTAIPLGVMSLVAFSTPDFEYKGKVIYAVVTYSLLLLMYAANNLPYSALSGVITGSMKERNSVSSIRFVAVLVAQFFVTVFMYPLVDYVGEGSRAAGFEQVISWMAVIGTIMLVITFLTTKERVVPKPEQESSFKEDIADLMKNKPWVIMLILTTLVFITLSMKGGAYVYYFNNYVDKTALANFLTPVVGVLHSLGMSFFDISESTGLGLFNAGGIIFMLIGLSTSKKLADKFGKRDVFGSALFVSTIFVLIFVFFSPKSIHLMFLAQVLHGFFYGITTPILWAMIADVADYSEWKNNRRATAIIFSAMMVGLKGGLSIGGGLIAWILGLYGYVAIEEASQGQALVQPESVSTGIRMLVSVFASIPFLLGIGLLFFYKIDKKFEVKLEKELAERRLKSN